MDRLAATGGVAFSAMQKQTKVRHLWLFLFLADILAVVASYHLMVLFRFHSPVGISFFRVLGSAMGAPGALMDPTAYESFYTDNAGRIILYITATVGLFYALLELYPARRFLRPRTVAWNILLANVAALGVFYTYFYLSRNTFHPRSFVGPVLLVNAALALLFRTWVEWGLDGFRRRGFDQWNALLAGPRGDADVIREWVEDRHPYGVRIARRLEVSPGDSGEQVLAAIEAAARAQEVDLLMVADPRLSVGEIMKLVELGERLNVPVKVLSDKLTVLTSQARMSSDTIRGVPLVHFEAPALNRPRSTLRRALTMVIAAVGLILLLPLMALIALLVAVTSRGPVLFTQERIGVDRKPFLMLKFRTMYDRADELQAQVEEFNESGPGLFKIRNDRRVTPVGRFLRRFSLDELPQLINVIRGDMAIVGPRPLPRRDFENYYEEWHYTRHAGVPGLTCLWQVSGRSDLDFHAMCILDIYYLTNRSWVLDLQIVLRTIWVVIFGKGAY